MSKLLVGCCGLAGMKLASYAAEFQVLEVQSTFYKLPLRSTAERWRISAPGLTFTMKAFQGITHPFDSPTWRRVPKKELEGVDPSDVGMLRPSKFVKRAWERTAETAHVMGAKVVVVQLPPSFACNEANLERIQEFFSGFTSDFTPAVEFRHESWLGKLQVVRDMLFDCDGIVVTDPLKISSPEQPVQYHRLHGSDGFVNFRHEYSEDELRELATKVDRASYAYVLFNNVSMREDAMRFKLIMGILQSRCQHQLGLQ
jgi:uncharacterized protein YecE (DUF72 family)